MPPDNSQPQNPSPMPPAPASPDQDPPAPAGPTPSPVASPPPADVAKKSYGKRPMWQWIVIYVVVAVVVYGVVYYLFIRKSGTASTGY